MVAVTVVVVAVVVTLYSKMFDVLSRFDVDLTSRKNVVSSANPFEEDFVDEDDDEEETEPKMQT